MRILKPLSHNIYLLSIKLLLLVSFCLLSSCCGQKETKQSLSKRNPILAPDAVVNINTASAKELVKLPNIGEKTALEILDYRERFGEFRRPEHLLLVPHISEKKFREIRDMIGVGQPRP